MSAIRTLFIPVSVVFVLLLLPHFSDAAQINVGMGPNYFSPSQITVAVGDTVVWKNTDSMAHNVTANNGSFSSGTLQPGATYSLSFSAPGTYYYNCTLHPGMTGMITVVASAGAQQSTVVYATPTPVPSPTADTLRTQTEALLARVRQLQAQLGSTQSITGSAGTGTGALNLDSSSCPLIGRSLKRGSSGDDVRRLQQFLARDSGIYPEAMVTGTYGALTEAAVKRWQVKYNIVSSGSPATTGYGVVGPRTAAAIALLCTTGSYNGVPGPSGGTGGSNVGGYIQVTPVAGNAPLTVAVQATINTVNSCAGATYIVDWGDGTQPSNVVQPAGNCAQQTQTLGHVYQSAGVYQVTLISGSHRTSATVQVFGSGQTSPPPSPSSGSDSVQASPRSGPAPLNVTFTGVVNAARSCDGGEYTLVFGDGESVDIPYPADGCTAYSYSREHEYNESGSFTARLYRGTQSGTQVASIGITVGQGNVTYAPFVVTPGIDGDPLRVQVDFPMQESACAGGGTTLSWGDGESVSSANAGISCSGTETLTHTYPSSGSYTITLVRNTQTDTAAVTISAQ